MVKTWLKSNLGSKRFICLIYLELNPLREAKTGTQGRDLEARTKSDTIEVLTAAYWPAHSWLTDFAFVYTQGSPSRGSITHTQLALAYISIIN